MVAGPMVSGFTSIFDTCKAQCGPCQSADPVGDRIKVDPALFIPPPPCKKNYSRAMSLDKFVEERKLEEDRQSALAEFKRIEAAEAAEAERRHAEAELAAQAEIECLEQERLQALETAEQHRLQPIEEQRCLEEQCYLEEQRCLEQQAQEAAERVKDEAAMCKVLKFLKDSGFSSVNSKKTSLMSHKYALHVAVERKDAEAVTALLRCKADPSLRNSSKKTPEQLASSINKKGSHDQVLTVLRAHSL